MKQHNALAYFRQLCCSELGKEAVMPELLQAVKEVVPSSFNIFSGLNEQLLTTYFISEFNSPELVEILPEVNRSFWTPDKLIRCAKWLSHHPVITDGALLDENFYKSDMYNLLYRRVNAHHVVHAPVFHNGTPVGMFSLARSCSQKPFSKNEQMLCVRLTSYVAHAMDARPASDISYDENGLSGMMVMDSLGEMLYLSESAKQLLTLALYPSIPMGIRNNVDEVTPKLVKLCRNLNAIFQGKDVAAPPSWCHVNGRGRFVFRAYWLDKQNREPGGLIGMTVEHQEPLKLKILRGLRGLPLSPTQKEVALLLAQGLSSDKIGERLHIKPCTLKDHIGKIFIKLDIHQREEVLPKLLAKENTTQDRQPV